MQHAKVLPGMQRALSPSPPNAPGALMPMIDVYARRGTFTDKHQLAVDLASTLMAIEGSSRNTNVP
jgi:hypothetical protein